MSNRWLSIGLFFVLALPAPAQDWITSVRRFAAERKFDEALAVVEQRVSAAPSDMEALGWRGRVHAWAGRWADAERDYRRVLEAVPQDAEIVLALADVLGWQQRQAEALALVERAAPLVRGTPLEVEAEVRRARLLRLLGRREESRASFRGVLRLDPANTEAKNALAASAGPPRHLLTFGFDQDHFNFTDAAETYAIALRSTISSRWVAAASLTVFNRFGEKPVRGAGAITYRATPSDAFTVGAAAADHRGIIARNEFFFDYNRGLRISETAPLRGLELSYAQRWLWFRDARILALTPSLLLYLPRDWTLSVQGTAARSRFPGTLAEWQPSGAARLSFPARERLTLSTFFAVGTENFARVEEVGRFSARTWGGGARWRFAARQDASFYVARQDRSQGRTQTSYGLSYGLRF